MTKLHRSTKHKSFGGVCAGLALSKGWSISLVRTIFLLLMSASGIGLLLYVIAWIALPTAESAGIKESDDLPHDAFQRSRSDKRVAGVCSGLAKYVHTDASLIRLIYLICIIFGGVGLISYIYAWMIVPQEGVA